jgi:hypothetical protein
MEQIKAFIGHSFIENDKILVDKFLEFFDTIKDLNISFSWDHAEKAEVDILSNKVLQKMQKSNTFIGICTKKEMVINNPQPKKCFFNNNNIILKNYDYEWKTSDWIIQEIGCAFGKGMKIILLIEKGLRQPGSLQGNLEFIEFERNNPEKVFQKILEMIQNLLPKIDKEIISYIDQKEQPLAIVSSFADKSKEKHQIIIRDEWERKDYFNGLFEAILFNDPNMESEIIEKFNNKYLKEGREITQTFKAKALFHNINIHNKDCFDELKQILDEFPNNHEINNMIAFIYVQCDQYEFAYNHYYRAYQNCDNDEIKIKNLSLAILNYIKTGKKGYNDLISKMMDLNRTNMFKLDIYSTSSEIAKFLGNDSLYFLILEAAVNDFPLNSKFRFDLAYRYYEKHYFALSYYHYNFLVNHFDESSSYWNNLGVSASSLSLPNKALNAYRKSEQLGETLAMSNIAQKYISEGFFEEAKLICNKALEIKGYHKNVIIALSQIETNITDENEREKQLFIDVNLKRNNILQIAKGLLQKQIKEISKYYRHPNCDLEVILKDENIKFQGTYNHKDIFTSFASFPLQPTIPKPISETIVKYDVEIEGTIFCHIIEGKYSNNKSDINNNEKIKNMKEIIMVVSEDMKLIEAYEKYKYEKIFVLTLKE